MNKYLQLSKQFGRLFLPVLKEDSATYSHLYQHLIWRWFFIFLIFEFLIFLSLWWLIMFSNILEVSVHFIVWFKQNYKVPCNTLTNLKDRSTRIKIEFYFLLLITSFIRSFEEVFTYRSIIYSYRVWIPYLLKLITF